MIVVTDQKEIENVTDIVNEIGSVKEIETALIEEVMTDIEEEAVAIENETEEIVVPDRVIVKDVSSTIKLVLIFILIYAKYIFRRSFVKEFQPQTNIYSFIVIKITSQYSAAYKFLQ